MNEDDMTLDQISAFHTLMCEAQKIIDSWDAEDDADQWGDDLRSTTDKHPVTMMMKDNLSPTFAKGIGA